jgi:outer membrane protein assembly factor BamB
VFVPDYVKKAGDVDGDPGRRNTLAGTERVLCFDASNGKELWKHAYDCPYNVSYPSGPRCTPTVSGGKVYALGAMGNLFCLDADKGTVVWSKDFKTDYKADTPMWGFAGHPLVYENLLVCLVGGPNALLVAFDKNTGKEVWKGLTADEPGYCPPTVIEAGGGPQLVIATPGAVVGLDPLTGKKYWDVPFRPHYAMAIAAPRPSGNHLFVGGYGDAVMVKLDPEKPAAEVGWRGKRHTAVYPSNSTPLVDGETVYGVDASGHLRAVDLKTGARLWEDARPVSGPAGGPELHGTAFLVRNADRYFLFNELGELVIAELSRKEYAETDRAKLVEPTGWAFGRKVVWSHPAFADKCVFVRTDKELACFSLAGK